MIEHTLDTEHSILVLRPQSALEQADFEQLGKLIDPYIEKTGGLAGIIIDAPVFPGWKSFGGLVSHLRFARDHHKYVKRIAVVSDLAIANVAEHLLSHFVSAEVRQFSAGQVDAARSWITAAPAAKPISAAS